MAIFDKQGDVFRWVTEFSFFLTEKAHDDDDIER